MEYSSIVTNCSNCYNGPTYIQTLPGSPEDSPRDCPLGHLPVPHRLLSGKVPQGLQHSLQEQRGRAQDALPWAHILPHGGRPIPQVKHSIYSSLGSGFVQRNPVFLLLSPSAQNQSLEEAVQGLEGTSPHYLKWFTQNHFDRQINALSTVFFYGTLSTYTKLFLPTAGSTKARCGRRLSM